MANWLVQRQHVLNLLDGAIDPGIMLRDEQIRWIHTVGVERQHVIGIAKTGFGKSMVFHALPFLYRQADEVDTAHPKLPMKEDACVLCVYPLKALQADQMKHIMATFASARPIILNGDTKKANPQIMKTMVAERYTHILASPEMVLSPEFQKDVLGRNEFIENLCAVVIDEVHCMDIWKGWRETYSRLEELRIHAGAKTPWLCVSATITPLMLKSLEDRLKFGQIDKDYHVYRTSVDRPEIFLAILPLQHQGHTGLDLQWILPYDLIRVRYNQFNDANFERRRNGQQVITETSLPPGSDRSAMGQRIPKTMIYADRISTGHKLMQRLVDMYLGPKTHIQLYNAGMSEPDRALVEEEFSKPNSSIRVLICTDAMGMGADLRSVEYVVQWMLPAQGIVPLWQRCGRAARGRGETGVFLWYVSQELVDTPNCPERKLLPEGVQKGKKPQKKVNKKEDMKSSQSSSQGMSQGSQLRFEISPFREPDTESESQASEVQTSEGERSDTLRVEKPAGKKSRKKTATADGIPIDLKDIIFLKDVYANNPEDQCIRERMLAGFENLSSGRPEMNQCCTRCNPEWIADNIPAPLISEGMASTVYVPKMRKGKTGKRLKEWREEVAEEFFARTTRKSKPTAKWETAILSDDYIKVLASSGPALDKVLADQLTEENQHIESAVHELLREWPWWSSRRDNGTPWWREIGTILLTGWKEEDQASQIDNASTQLLVASETNGDLFRGLAASQAKLHLSQEPPVEGHWGRLNRHHRTGDGSTKAVSTSGATRTEERQGETNQDLFHYSDGELPGEAGRGRPQGTSNVQNYFTGLFNHVGRSVVSAEGIQACHWKCIKGGLSGQRQLNRC